MAIPDAIKVKIRRHLRYGTAGLYRISPAGGTVAAGSVGYRFFQAYGQLEYKMNNLLPGEEAAITGMAMGSVGFVGPNPNTGDTFNIHISGGGLSAPVTVTVAAQQGDVAANIAAKIAAAGALNTSLQLAGFYVVAPYGTGPYAANAIPIAEVSFVAPSEFSFNVSASSAMGAMVTTQGEFQSPFADLKPGQTTYGWIPILDQLEGAYMGASQNLDTRQADVWHGRSNELGQRLSLYSITQERFSEFLGVPINPQASPGRFQRQGAIRYL